MNDAPIFRDASHALHVSFMIHAMPARTVSPTAMVIDQLLRETGKWDGAPDAAPGSVNFAGLSPLEVRGQCAQVVAMVNHLAHVGERAACQAAYGHQAIKADGVRGIAAYVAPTLTCQSSGFALYCAWHVYATPRQRDGLTQGEIAAHFGVTVAAVREASATIRKYGKSLLNNALTSLGSRFEEGGLIGEAVAAL
jgi:hypothetical protein